MFARVLTWGSVVPVNGGEMVELVTVPLFDGPLVVAKLRDNGIDATAIEAFSVVTWIASDVRIMVRRSDVGAAREVIAER